MKYTHFAIIFCKIKRNDVKENVFHVGDTDARYRGEHTSKGFVGMAKFNWTCYDTHQISRKRNFGVVWD